MAIKDMYKKIKKYSTEVIVGGVVTAIVTFGVIASEYQDIFGFDNKRESGRSKNSIAAIVSGIVGKELYGDSNIDLEVKKSLWPDARVTGYTTENSIDTSMNLFFTSVHFTGRDNISGMLKGDVDKSEFDWKVKQKGKGIYEINRFGPKFDAKLRLKIENGKITGEYERPGPNIDWDIDGTYDNQGNVNIEIDGPLTLGVRLEGKIRGTH